MKKFGKRFTSLLLVLLLLVTSVIGTRTVYAEGEEADESLLSWEVVENDAERAASKMDKANFEAATESLLKGDVRVSIVLDGKSTMDVGYSAQAISLDPSAISYRESLKESQDEISAVISRDVLDGEDLDVVWNLTLAANIISANVPAEKIDEIKAIEGVKDVVVELQYYPQEDEVTDEPMMSISSGMTSTTYAWASGYTGAGSKVAIVDTGLDIDHQSFNSEAFDAAIALDEMHSGNTYDLMEEKDVKKFWSMLNAAQRAGGDGSEAYLNSKVPFRFNYVDYDFDVTHLHDTQGEHGSHVAGIAAANKYILNENKGIQDAIDAVKTHGNAPDAQVLVMKVFGKGGGAYDSDYFAAIEDAIVLGADSVNLSLGSSNAGLTYNPTYKEIIDGMTGVNLVWANSAGNNSYWAEQTSYALPYADGVNFATGGSPATYANTLSVASVDNDGFTGSTLEYEGERFFFTETYGYGNDSMATIAGTYEFIYVDGPGVADNDYSGNVFAELSEEVKDKIAMCNRGSSSFFAKANAAAAEGAAGVIVVNNQPGTISMNLSGYTYSVPVVSITQAEGQMIKASSEAHEMEDGTVYYTGTITVNKEVRRDTYDSEYYTMSSFTSWGVPGDLSLKPEITAPGGNIYSVFGTNMTQNGFLSGGTDQYENMSGTSMASPQIAGIIAVMAQYVRENGLDKEAERLGITRRALIQSLLMSTAEPLIDGNSGNYYPVIQQGSGLADVEAAINSNVVVLMDSTAVNGEARKDITAYAKDGKVKAELGDDPDRSGKYTVEFTLNNISDEDLAYDLNADFFTQDVGAFYADYGIEDEFIDTFTANLYPNLTWYVNDTRFEKDVTYDFDGNPDVYDDKDAMAILNAVVAENTDSLPAEADLNDDGKIDTYDAYLALRLANEAAAIVPAQGKTQIRVEIEFDEEEFEGFDNNGAYVEGYIFAQERDAEDGAIGVLHSIPVFGYYGGWSEASSVDVGSVLEYRYGLEERVPYMYAALSDDVLTTAAGQTFIYNDVALGGSFVLGGNPLDSYLSQVVEDYELVYYPERNAFNSNNVLEGFQYSLIRNAAATRFDLTDAEGEVIEGSAVEGGSKYAAYYYPSGGEWRSTTTSNGYGYSPKGAVEEGDRVELRFLVAPEYYYDANYNIEWDKVEASKTLPLVIDNTAPVFESIVAERVTKTVETGEVDETGAPITAEQEVVEIKITVADNEYLAGLFINDEDDGLWFAQGARTDEKQDAQDVQEYELSYDASMPDHLYMEAFDYAGNLTTVKVNLNKEELTEPIEVTLDQEYVSSAVGGSFKLNATVTPWGIENPKVNWTSADESIATVNENGVVTGVGEGVTVITATSDADPEKSASCYVEFILIEEELNGIVWDENGEVWFTQFNTATIPDYTKLSPSMRMELTSTSYAEDGKLYAVTFDSEGWLSTLYTVDENTYELSEVGASSIGYMDLCPAPSLGGDKLLGVYGPYVVIIDRTTGDYSGVFDMSSYTGGNYLVGIAYEEQYNHPSYGNTDWVFFLDEAGNIYNTGFLPYGGSFSRFSVSKIGQIGDAVDIPYWQSLYYDGASLFWSRFNQASNKVDLIMVYDLYNDGSIFKLGSFADSVWPVSGLYSQEVKELIGAENASSRHADATVDEAAVFETEVGPVSLPAVAGKLDSVVGNRDGSLITRNDVTVNVDPANEDPDLAVVLIKSDGTVETEDGITVTHNGLFEVEYDAEVLELKDVVSNVKYFATAVTEGKVRFGFMDLEGVATDDVIAKLVFNRLSDEVSDVTVTELEKDNDAEVSEPIEYAVEDSEYYDWGDILPEDRPESIEEVPEEIWLSKLTDVVYNGSKQTQEFRVYHGRKMLTEGKDYTVSYQNNTKAGTATVKVTGKGNYKDAKTKTFEILPAQFSENETVIVLNKDAFVFNNNKQKATIAAVYHNSVRLTKNKDYTITYSNINSLEEGTYTLTITGKGNYAGSVDTTYLITKDLKPVSSLGIFGVKAATYTGEPIYQDVVVRDNGTELKLGVDYVLEYRDNVEVGMGFVTIRGLGNYAGSVTKNFRISAIKLNANNTTLTGLPTEVKYNGEVRPEVRLTMGNLVLIEGEDYTVTYKNNAKVGTANVQIKGIGNYAGSFSKSFKITAINLSNGQDIIAATVPAQPYQKGGSKPDLVLFDCYNGVELVSGKDYTLTYKNNSKQGTATVTAKGKGNYTGTISKEFTITASDLSALTATAADKKFANSKNNFKSNIVITDTNGKKLAAGTDYDKNVVYTYADGQPIAAGTIVPAGTVVKVTAQGKGNYTGSATAEFRITAANISGASVKVADQIYTGKEVKVDKAEITVKMNGNLLNKEDFEIVSYQNNVNKGTAKITIQGLGNYGGTKTVSFRIVQKSFLNAIWSFFR